MDYKYHQKKMELELIQSLIETQNIVEDDILVIDLNFLF
jgi:hypothetical protein